MMKMFNLARLAFLGTWAAAMLLTGCAAQKDPQLHAMRQRFVPVPHDSSGGGGANWTALHQFSDDEPGVLMLMARAGIGDTFPIQEENLPKLFDVIVVAGDDDHLMLEVRSEEVLQRLDLRRDETLWVKVAGHKYSLAYPSVTVNSDSQPTTDRAMILVHRYP